MEILVIDDEIGAVGSVHQKAFLRAHDDPSLAFIFETGFDGEKYHVDTAVAAMEKHPNIKAVLLDLRFGPQGDRLGFEILHAIARHSPSLPVVVMSSVDRDFGALGRCLEEGAVAFVSKAQSPVELRETVKRALGIARAHVLLGQSTALRELRRQAARLSPYGQVPVLIVGERGTGKERVARYIHHNGPRSSAPFVALNCAGLADSLVDTELFGAEQGAYTGADRQRTGYLEKAQGGVLFLDEIGNMPITTQVKLLRVLQDNSFRRVGVSQEEIRIDFQVICASNIEPDILIREGRLREDLYDRIAAFTIRTPPLRVCKSDISTLAKHFLREMGVNDKKRFAPAVLKAFEEYDWPGNVRELRRLVQECVVYSENSSTIKPEHIPEHFLSRMKATTRPRGRSESIATEESSGNAPDWPHQRLMAELTLALEVKRRVQRYKGKHWKAEFMRLMYPECRAQNAKGFQDLLRRLTKGPWGCTGWKRIADVAAALNELQR